MHLVPLGLLLKPDCRLQDSLLAQRRSNKLQSHRQIIGSQTTWDADSRQSAEVSYSAQGIGEAELVIQVRLNSGGSYGQRCGDQHIKARKHIGDFGLQDAPYTVCPYQIS